MDKYENDGNISKAQNGKVKNKDAKWIEDAATKHQKCGIGIEDPTCKTEPTLQFPGMPTYENMSNPVNLWNWPEGRKEQKAFMSNVDTRQQILSQQYPNLTKEALITALRDSARTNQLLNNPGYTKLFDEWFELNGKAITITNQTYIDKLRGNPSFVELDDSLLINNTTKETETIEATETVEKVVSKFKKVR